MKHIIQTPLTGTTRQGFTLVELMIVVAIVSILATVAYPSYTQYTTRSNRSAAQSFILGVANKQEQYILDARIYTDSLNTLNMTVPAEVSKNYGVTISGVTTTPPAYIITATPTGTQLARDTLCGTLTINQAGVKGESGTGTVANCW